MVVQIAEEWDDSLQTKEKIEASLLHKYEAALRRERALAYSYTHQVHIYEKTLNIPSFYCTKRKAR